MCELDPLNNTANICNVCSQSCDLGHSLCLDTTGKQRHCPGVREDPGSKYITGYGNLDGRLKMALFK